MSYRSMYRIFRVFHQATGAGTVPDGHYGPETCRWATREEVERFGLNDYPLVHLDDNGDIDCYFTESRAVVVKPAGSVMN